MAKRSNEITTSTVDVVWANLRRPDEFRGSKKHDISIVMNEFISSIILIIIKVDTSGYLTHVFDCTRL